MRNASSVKWSPSMVLELPVPRTLGLIWYRFLVYLGILLIISVL